MYLHSTITVSVPVNTSASDFTATLLSCVFYCRGTVAQGIYTVSWS